MIWTIDRLCRFVQQHDCECEIRSGKHGSELWALDRWVERDGTQGQRWRRVGASIKAVKRFLKY